MNRAQRRASKSIKHIKPDRNAKYKRELPLLEKIRDGFEPLENFLDACLSDEGVDVDETGTPIILWKNYRDEDDVADAMSSVLLMLEFTLQCLIMQKLDITEFDKAYIIVGERVKNKIEADCPVERADIIFAKKTVAWAKQIVTTTPNSIRARVLDEISAVTQRVGVTKVSTEDLRAWLHGEDL